MRFGERKAVTFQAQIDLNFSFSTSLCSEKEVFYSRDYFVNRKYCSLLG